MIFNYAFILEAFGPFLLLMIYGSIKLKRQRAKINAEGYAEPTFASDPSPAPRGLTALGPRLFPRLNAPQQAYLEFHLKQVRMFFLCGVYAVTSVATSGLFPNDSNTFGSDHQSPLYVWLNFLQGWSLDSIFLSIVAIGAAFVLAMQFAQGESSRFYRTRPLSLSFLFWTRTTIATLTLCASLIAGFVLSFLMLIATHGLVWRPLTKTIGLTIVHGVMRINLGATPGAVFRGLVSSPFRLALCNILGAIVVYALSFTFFLLPAVRLKTKIAVGFGVLIFGVMAAQMLIRSSLYHFARLLFLYPRLGPPPPYIFAVVPLALIAAFLYLARISFTYLES